MDAYVLGLDLGSASIGWAVIEPGKRVVDCGVRIFDPGVNLEMFRRGQEGSSNNINRRMARLHRRQLRRRAGRQRDLFQLLQQQGLLPSSEGKGGSEERHQMLQGLDAELRIRWRDRAENEGCVESSMIYVMRKQALDSKLEAHELGRVLYQLCQRRGFKSSRLDADHAEEGEHKKGKTAKENDDAGVVKAGIEELRKAMQESRARTLGEYMVSLSAGKQKLRRRWTDRQMYVEEFEAIWKSQAAFHPQLTDELKQQVHKLLFYQRPISSGERMVGMCELEPKQRRAAKAALVSQRFRLLQKVNDLEHGDATSMQRLSAEQRTKLAAALEDGGDLTFPQVRSLLGLSKKAKFNLERGGEKKIPGNRTNAAMLRAMPERWPALAAKEREGIVEAWLGAADDAELTRQLLKSGLTDAEAEKLCALYPEKGHVTLSRKAMEKLLPLMESGARFKSAEDSVYGTSFSGGQQWDRLPPVKALLPYVPNPAVMRALTELRKVVNALVGRYGKPGAIRIELARDLKRNAREREAYSKSTRSRQNERERARRRVLEEAKRPMPSGQDIERVLLFEECGGICVYCGEPINFQRLFDGDIEVDHILPRFRFNDNSFANRALAHHSCNQGKGNRTPHEAFAADVGQWEQVMARVARWRNQDKLRRFQIADAAELDPENEEGFAARRLNDTRYVSKLAARYLGALYGGRDMALPGGKTRRMIHASSGMLTAMLRREWRLEKILEEAEPASSSRKAGKPRTDHRHHAVDAMVIALTSNAYVGLQNAAAAAAGDGRGGSRRVAPESPWPDFVDSVRPLIERLKVSHRAAHKLQGPLHDETNYSSPRTHVPAPSGRRRAAGKPVVHIRKPVHLLTEKQIAQDIVDPSVRKAVLAKLEQLGDAKKLEADPAVLVTRTGKQVPIYRARVRVSTPVVRIATGERERYVATGGNHHVSIFETRDKRGRLKWESSGVVSRLEAVQRKQAGKNVIEKSWRGEEARYLFSLMGGDVVEMQDAKLGRRNLFVVRTVSDAELTFVRHTDARKLAEMGREARTDADLVRNTSIDKLREWECRKVFVDVLGKVRG